MIDIKYHYLCCIVGTKDNMLTIIETTIIIDQKIINIENYLVKKVEVNQFQFFDKSYNIVRIGFIMPLIQVSGPMAMVICPTRVFEFIICLWGR